jgi:hypothetical protein
MNVIRKWSVFPILLNCLQWSYTSANDLLRFHFLIFILEEILKILKTQGLQGTTALSRQAGQEILSVLKFTKS